MMSNTDFTREVKAWIKRKTGPGEIVHVVPESRNDKGVICYQLYSAFDKYPDYLGRILFDAQGYWIYDGEALSIAEQEQLAKFIINYTGSN